MRRELDYIIKDLTDCFDGKPWYGDSIMKKLNSIKWQTANEEVYGTKSIAVLLQHIINWRIFVIKKLEGDAVYDIVIDELNDWTAAKVGNEEEWKLMLDEIQNTQKQILANLSKHDDNLLNMVVPGKNYKFGPILRSISQHDIYHLGQIAMLNSMSKS